jgi:peptide-methionine (S)-S-oxide reductase
MRNYLMWLVFASLMVVALYVFWTKGMLGLPGTSDSEDRIRRARTPAGSGADKEKPPGCQQATFGAGCFWCAEAVFQQLNGVHSVVSGYSGGSLKNPSYEQVCSGATGCAEVVQITFDPKVISFSELLEIFWKTHDPTTRDRQGNDHGPQYRSVIFYHSPEQKEFAELYKQKLDTAGVFSRPIVTEIAPFSEFYAAEKYHQNYYLDHSRQPYCSTLIRPKLEKFEKVFKDKLRTPAPE